MNANPISLFETRITAQYDPQIHTLPIYWLNSLLIRGMRGGEHDKSIKNIPTIKYQPNCIVVKVNKCWRKVGNPIGLVTINFMGDMVASSWRNYAERQRVELYKSSKYNTTTKSYESSLSIDSIRFADGFQMDKLPERLCYINHIIEQLNTI